MPKIIGATLGEHREKTRQALFDALSSLLREQSFESITMAQIARRAGVGRTAVYNHFEDKDSLLLALMSATTEQFTAILTEALQVIDDPLQQIRIYTRAQLELKHHYHLTEGVNLRRLTASQPTEKLREHAHIVEHILHHLLAAAQRKDQISVAPSPGIINLIHTCLAGQVMPKRRTDREKVILEVETFILRGLGANEEAVANVDPRVAELRFVFGDESETNLDSETLPDGDDNYATYLRCPINVVA
ncbi:MAG: TetR/AcrR family transcriptional regulator [Actinomycetaceae bacterium]|nr:TetR/AcrR family transcriptional regulator [Actinomycetaceae bacterium]